jgi:capsular polysaccharide transport system ATP-binding protein
MIILDNVSKDFKTHSGRKAVLRDVSIAFPEGRNIGIFGLNGAGKSTLIKILSGAEAPDKGKVIRQGLVSFPLGFDSCMHHNLTGRENVKFIARVYGIDVDSMVEYVEWFAEIGSYFDMPLNTYSSGMRSKLAFGTCLAVDFDVYLIDEITEVGDSRFRRKAFTEFQKKMLHADIILVSHNIDTIRTYCDMGAVLSDGRLDLYDNLDDAMTHYKALVG